jgi:hypothetical protein
MDDACFYFRAGSQSVGSIDASEGCCECRIVVDGITEHLYTAPHLGST